MAGQLYARVGGAWVPVIGGVDEVSVQPNDPISTNPQAELWYDTDAVAAPLPTATWGVPWGVVARATKTAPDAGVTATTDIAGLSVTWNAVNGRLYRVSYDGYVQHNTANATINVNIADASNAQLQSTQVSLVAANTPYRTFASYYAVGAGAAMTAKARIVLVTAGTFFAAAGPAYPSYLTVEDLGPVSSMGTPSPPAQYAKTIAISPLTSANTGTGYSDWIPIDTAVNVPAWATKANVRMALTYLMFNTGGNVYGVRLALGTAVGFGFNFDDVSKTHFDINIVDQIPLSGSGSQNLRVQANRIAGSGVWQAGPFGTCLGINIDWLA